MVCDRRYLQATATSVFMAGMMVGVIVTGTLSDQYVISSKSHFKSHQKFVFVPCNFNIESYRSVMMKL